ncbi:NACHT, LRR and PYD domains-containing protein 3-like [Hippoglossus hippoglossus]|uniref:NACHT, LRR and PYD domains-containing protein 3-like n=1 Tax=Hippoglossus hippoglossus TaxID=8267 RepID=UPI00148B8513|nr:NACHT, LRR and PYD domains-containing protein 3-like [Hippoglossus hippoglossus]XP_034426702.1 NACHT, LRR and PYD domains-containing protein 3-like [Hippoglossus hippoglossus]
MKTADEEHQCTDQGEDVKNMEEKRAADRTDEVSQGSLESIQDLVHHLPPSICAQSGSSVVAPSIYNSNIGNLNITISSVSQGSIVEALNQDSCGSLQLQSNKVAECQRKLRETLKRKFSHLLEGLTTHKENKIPLNNIYTELYITEGGSAEVNKEHEVRQIETTSRMHVAQEKSIHCNEIFAPPPGRHHYHVRTVITRGVAGIGKTVSANKFTLDWADEIANTDLEFVFPLAFRELNLMTKKTFSLEELLCVFFPDTKDTGIFTNSKSKMLFILDGLDESRLCLDFNKNEIVSDVKQSTKIAVLVTNLIRGTLLPQSLVWITSRPVASSQIPVEYVDLVTEVRGFNNQQKDDYFRRKIADESLANRVIAHVKSCRSLHIMCHIPVFCWMAASVLGKQLAMTDSKDTPKTLTKMYIHFLSLYVQKRLPGRRESNADVRDNLISLGKLAFKELEKGHLIFYEKDLIKYEINVSQASMFSGVYTQIFSEELSLGEEKMFCFVHLSVQEFFAALYVFLMFHNNNDNVLVKKSSASRLFQSRNSSEVILYKEAVEKTLQCENGHFDIFLRFLLGLSLDSSQTLLKHLMTSNRTNERTRAEIIKHIKERIRSSPSTDRCLNLFHCLYELNDQSLVEEIQSCLSSGSLNTAKLSPAQWATLVFVLLTSEEELSVFELSNYTRSEEGLVRLLPVVKTAQVANLKSCNLTVTCCEILANCIGSSRITELDLSNNNLTDSGIILLSAGLKKIKLETLRLRSCSLTDQCCGALASFLSSASCQLKVLDLTDNDFQDTGISVLAGGLGSPHCKLEILILSLCRVTEEGCTYLASALNSSRLRELNLSYNHPGDLGLQLLSALLDDPQCSLQKLSVEECGESRIQPGPKKYITKLSLDPNTAHEDMALSEENTKAERWTKQPYPDHPERFDFWRQVLCQEGLSGRCYWETEWSGRTFIGVAYRRMCRKGEEDDSWLGRNDSSWGLSCTNDGFRAVHSTTNTALTITPSSYRVGVLLDWSAGTLSFYLVSSCASLTLLHTFHTSFTEAVYPGFQLAWVGATINLC